MSNEFYIKNTPNGYFCKKPDNAAFTVYNSLYDFKLEISYILYQAYIDNIIIPIVWEEYKNEYSLLEFKQNTKIFFNTELAIHSYLYNCVDKYRVILNNSIRNETILQNIYSFVSKINKVYFNTASVIFYMYDNRHKYNFIEFIRVAMDKFGYLSIDFELNPKSKNELFSNIDAFIKYLSKLKSNMQECNNDIDNIINTLLKIKSEFDILT